MKKSIIKPHSGEYVVVVNTKGGGKGDKEIRFIGYRTLEDAVDAAKDANRHLPSEATVRVVHGGSFR